jgi:hypothetical protein
MRFCAWPRAGSTTLTPSVFAAVIVGLLAPALLASAESADCDPNLQSAAGDAFGYRARGDRCEGLYIREVGSRVLHVVSFTRSFDDFRSDTADALTLSWTTASDASVRLRGEGTRPSLYYRMDTLQPATASPYQWSPGLLAALEIQKSALGVTAWTRQTLGGADRNVYLPLRVGQGEVSDAQQLDPYRVVVVPGRDLREIYVSLSPVDEQGKTESPLIDAKPVAYGYYPIGAGVPIEVPAPKADGVYRLELGAELRSGGAASVDLLFHHLGD